MITKKSLAYIGTSGWHYTYWKKHFYPADMPSKDFLSFFKEKFNCVEINNSFYKVPTRETFIKWKDTTPDNFTFAVKAPRYITHMKKLKDTEEAVTSFIGALDVLESKLGPILFQLPPRWKCNIERLTTFLSYLDKKHTYTFEFRDETWLNDEVYCLLKKHNIALCVSEVSNKSVITADFHYMRLHGPGEKYVTSYSEKDLLKCAGIIKNFNNKRITVFCFFDNDHNAYAANNARVLKSILEVK